MSFYSFRARDELYTKGISKSVHENDRFITISVLRKGFRYRVASFYSAMSLPVLQLRCEKRISVRGYNFTKISKIMAPDEVTSARAVSICVHNKCASGLVNNVRGLGRRGIFAILIFRRDLEDGSRTILLMDCVEEGVQCEVVMLNLKFLTNCTFSMT